MNNVILSMTYRNAGASTTTSSSEAAAAARGGVGGVRAVFLMKTLRMLLLMLMVLSAPYIQPSLAESETNDLNTLEQQNATAAPQLPIPQKPLPLHKLELRQYPNAAQYVPPQGPMPPQSTFAGCPLCDSSVYSYCSHKLIHDSCCCDFPGSIYQKPPECVYYECSLLYAKSCYEHSLIKNCCCNNPY
uniref:CCC domain-containing protein n=1 Tax=Musca domestica TaxID=7370 RepID=A0A1I8MQJ8_MUSDO